MPFLPLAARLSLAVDFGPVGKFLDVEFCVQVRDPLLKTSLRVRNGPVVNDGTDFFQKKWNSKPAGKSPRGSGIFSRK
jgi:hypothetical protein